jgi:hypothetical protein
MTTHSFCNVHSGWDYCFIPNSSSAPIKSLGQNACYNGNCNICEGDCDFDSDCAGNLKCYQRDSLMSSVPGCTGETYGGEFGAVKI